MFNSPQRNHPTIILQRLLSFLGLAFFMVFAQIGDSDIFSGRIFSRAYWENFIAQLVQGQLMVLFSRAGILILLIIVSFFAVRVWKKTTFKVSGGMLIVEKDTLFKKHSSLPIAHIATVNLESNVFEQLIGTSKVKLDLSSAATANASDFVFVLKTDKAREFKEYILGLKAEELGEEVRENQLIEKPRQKIISFSFNQVLRHAVLNVPIAQVFVASLLFLPALFEEDVFHLGRITAILLISTLIFFGKIALEALRFTNFSLERDDERFYLDYGLLRLRSYSFSHDRIKAIIVRQPLLARIFGFYFIEATVIGLGNEKNETPVLSLLVSKDKLQRILSACLPEFACVGEKIPSPKQALIPLFSNALIPVLAGLILFIIPFDYALLAFILICILSFLSAYLSYRTKSISYDDKVIHLTSGIFSKKTVMLKHGDIQKIDIMQNRLLSRFKFGRIRLFILASAMSNVHISGYVELEHLNACSEKI